MALGWIQPSTVCDPDRRSITTPTAVRMPSIRNAGTTVPVSAVTVLNMDGPTSAPQNVIPIMPALASGTMAEGTWRTASAIPIPAQQNAERPNSAVSSATPVPDQPEPMNAAAKAATLIMTPIRPRIGREPILSARTPQMNRNATPTTRATDMA